ncbi:MAG TPA: flagellar hook-length control protein FliK [Spirochaetales bacterium]|nr:flagellar hook-length control protein FliK [Spirochaetales bacterium]HPG85853.1 flagellar hook-length control protein FliK [Spirochaetales bacterium]
MLALTRTVTAQSGLGASPPKADSAKAASVQGNPFTRLLVAAERGVARAGTNAAKADGAGASRGVARRAVSAPSGAGGSNAALRAPAPAEASAGAEAARAKATATKRSAGDARGIAGKHPDEAPVSNVAAFQRRSVAGDEASARDGASALAAIAARDASGAQAAKPTLVPGRDGSDQRRSGGENGSSGIETVGVGAERRADGAKVTVVDLRLKATRGAVSRREAGNEADDRGGLASTAKPAGVADAANPGLALGEPVAETAGSAKQPIEAVVAPTPPTAEGLASRLREGAADIVRSAQIVLRGGDSGVIRLRLEPESLGGVKIELKMAEKQISGKIVVESDIAAEAFRSSLDSLKDAFAECGFETSALEVEVRNGMASGGDGRAGSERDDGPYWSRSLRELDAAVPQLVGSGRDGLLDVVV